MKTLATEPGRRLYELLPEVYRTRDKKEGKHLRRYLDGFEGVLDAIHALLWQRLGDSFPDQPPPGSSIPPVQDWLLPYFADLFGVELVSPDAKGRRAEVTKAIHWRQRKGTLRVIEDLVKAIGQPDRESAGAETPESTGVCIQEGATRLVTTARIAWPVREPVTAIPQKTNRQTSPLPRRRYEFVAGTVDFRKAWRAGTIVETGVDPRPTSSREEKCPWRQIHPDGAPCFPGSFEDGSRRTADFRMPTWRHGHYHPARIVVFVPPPTGFFRRGDEPIEWKNENTPEDEVYIEQMPADIDVTTDAVPVTLKGLAAKRLVVQTASLHEPVVRATNCLFDEIIAGDGLVHLEYCTVIKKLTCAQLQATDCILPDETHIAGTPDDAPPASQPKPAPGCIRYSRVPAALLHERPRGLSLFAESLTSDKPVFMDFVSCGTNEERLPSTAFGNPGYGVLHPAAPDSIRLGAENGGEMGAFHHQQHCLRDEAVRRKLERYLPLGMEAVLVRDPRLLEDRPKLTNKKGG